ncbi:MAG TPA: 4-hydroxy-tetrahydrodipicolinate reductase, partial [Lactobacillus sp.]|nr:4-hydroxy-tetrahydrodipicolinate reductase [Lactobacillus sp.]
DSFARQSFMQGVAVAISKVQEADQLVVGLENFL